MTSTDGLQRLGRLTALPSLPYDFPGSIASDSLVQVVRTAIESATPETLNFLVSIVNESLAETKDFRELGTDSRPLLLSMIENHGSSTNLSPLKWVLIQVSMNRRSSSEG